jgi:hypothetical protein
MATENKETVYLLTVDLVFTTLTSSTGEAPIADLSSYIITETVPTPPKTWELEANGPIDNTDHTYQIQTYTVPAGNIATFINDRHGTAFTATDIVDLRVSTDSTFYEIETT